MSRNAAFTEPHERCAHKRYRLTCEEYDALLRSQSNACALCGDGAAPLVVDHDHNLGLWAVRGLLCGLCNTLMASVDNGRWQATEVVGRYLANPYRREEPASPPVRLVGGSRKRTYKGTPLRAYRVSDETYERAQAKAAERGETVSDVLRRALQAYVEED